EGRQEALRRVLPRPGRGVSRRRSTPRTTVRRLRREGMIPMTTFYDPATIRRLAATGDAFYRGAAWILDQQDAARVDTTDYDSEWTRRAPNARAEWDGYSLCGR